MAKKPPGSAERTIVYIATACGDVGKFLIAFIPGVDLIDVVFCTISTFCLTLYFFIRFGFGYLSGKRAGQKLSVLLGSAAADMVPVLDGFLPELTIQAATTFYIMDKEYAEAMEAEAKQAAANDAAARPPRLSRRG